MTSARLGFVILSHDNPKQLLRLTSRLNSMFGFPPIACHHDFSKSNLNEPSFTHNIEFVKPHIVTARGRWSVVEATISALRVLMERSDAPQWFTIISGADYPIKPASVILSDFGDTECDAFIHAVSIDPSAAASPFQQRAVWRYFRPHLELPTWLQRYMPFAENRALPRWWPSRKHPFSNVFRCYAGSQFFSGNARCARRILSFHSSASDLKDFFVRWKVPSPEEAYFQCIVVNDTSLTVSSDNRRYIDWSPGTGHPKTLTKADLPALVRSNAHFARKFDPALDDEIYVRLDETLSSAGAARPP